MTQVDWRGYRLGAWIGVGILIGLVVLVARTTSWNGRLTSGTCLAIVAPLVIRSSRVPSLFGFIFMVAAVASAAGWFWGLYERVWLFDEFIHVIATLALTLVVGFCGLYARVEGLKRQPFLLAISLVSFGVALGVAWELIEFYIMTLHPPMNLPDTISDLVMDGVGAVLAIPLSLRTMAKF